MIQNPRISTKTRTQTISFINFPLRLALFYCNENNLMSRPLTTPPIAYLKMPHFPSPRFPLPFNLKKIFLIQRRPFTQKMITYLLCRFVPSIQERRCKKTVRFLQVPDKFRRSHRDWLRMGCLQSRNWLPKNLLNRCNDIDREPCFRRFRRSNKVHVCRNN